MNNFSTGWFKAIRDPDALELLKQSPSAFVLLYVIAARARWRGGINRHGLVQGEAFIGDYKEYGMTERRYRTAKQVLQKRGLATFRPTNRGTVARLCDASLFDINIEPTDGQSDGQIDRQATDSRRASDGQATTNEERKKERREETLPPPPPAVLEEDFIAECRLLGMPGWKIDYWVNKKGAENPPWNGVGDGLKFARLANEWWQQDGAPAQRPVKAGQQGRPDRNAGTANEGLAHQYAGVGRVQSQVSPSVEMMNRRDELKRVEARLDEIKNGASHVAGGDIIYTDAERAERKRLRERRDELKALLGCKA